jgi:sugar lactone lactonase YvrE
MAALGLMTGVLAATPADAWHRGNVQVLTVLPDIAPGVKSSVEGLTVGPDGNIYVPTFGVNTNGPILTGNAVLFVISPNGKIVRQVTILNSSPHMLGLAFNPANGNLLICDLQNAVILNVDPVTGMSSVFMDPKLAHPAAFPALNGITFDKSGNVYVSDSFNGVIWTTDANGTGTTTAPKVWIADPLLAPGTGIAPPVGANGVEFNNAGTIMFVANSAFHQIIQIPVNSDGSAGKASVFVTGINSPDGIMLDLDDNIWICANQEDEIVVVDNTGKVVAKLGDFEGIDPKGIARGLLTPASLAFSPDRKWLYVSNFTIYLPFLAPFLVNPPQLLAIDSAWTLQVQGYTVSVLPAKIPPFPGD